MYMSKKLFSLGDSCNRMKKYIYLKPWTLSTADVESSFAHSFIIIVYYCCFDCDMLLLLKKKKKKASLKGTSKIQDWT